MVLNEVKKIILGTKKYGGYSYFSWIPTVFYSVNNYNFLRKIGVEPKEIKEYKVVYFPLHLEPEQSLLSLSPEFGNITEAIHLISKNLPCDYVLVLKEQPFCFAVRDKIFYRQMSQIGNIFFAKPEISSHRWINAADIVIAITGTVGIEAIYENKFVLSFGKHQIINYLPSVHYVRNYSEVSDAIRGILNSRVDSDVLSQSKKIIKKSQFEVSFTLKEYKYSIHDSSLCIDLAMKTIENLMITHRDIFI